MLSFETDSLFPRTSSVLEGACLSTHKALGPISDDDVGSMEEWLLVSVADLLFLAYGFVFAYGLAATTGFLAYGFAFFAYGLATAFFA